MRGWAICFFINLFVCFYAKSQPVALIPSCQPNNLRDTTMRISTSFKAGVNRFDGTTIKLMPPAFYFNSIGFFCRRELEIEKALKFPLKLRLGSVAYTDQMEGKGKGVPY